MLVVLDNLGSRLALSRVVDRVAESRQLTQFPNNKEAEGDQPTCCQELPSAESRQLLGCLGIWCEESHHLHHFPYDLDAESRLLSRDEHEVESSLLPCLCMSSGAESHQLPEGFDAVSFQLLRWIWCHTAESRQLM